MAGPHKVHKGQRLAGYPGDAHNAFVDATRKINQTPPPFVQPRPSTGPDEQVQVLVQNKTGAALTERFPILRLTDPIATPADITDAAQVVLRGVQFEGAAPDADTGANFVVLQGPCGVDGFRPAMLMGLSFVKVDVQSESDTHATSIDGDDEKLISGSSGALIKWKETGTGVKWAIVLLGAASGGSDIVKGMLYEEIPAYQDYELLQPGLLDHGIFEEVWNEDTNRYDNVIVGDTGEPDFDPVFSEWGGINATGTPIVGSEEIPISVWGVLRQATFQIPDTEEFEKKPVLEIFWYDLASLPNTTLSPGKSLVPYKPDGLRVFQNDANPCPPPEAP